MLSALMLFGFAACGSRDGGDRPSAPQPANEGGGTENVQDSSGQQEEERKESSSEGKTLVVYYSATGYTEKVANYIAEATGGELFELEPAEVYSREDLDWTNKDSRVSREYANPEEREAALAASTVSDWETYDTVFIGYPIWWGDMPRILYTFFDAYDFSGKTIAPFCTSGGSGLSGTPKTIAELESGATVLDGLHVSDSAADNSESKVSDWLADIGRT